MKPSVDYAAPRHGVPLALHPGTIPDWRPAKDGFVPTLTPMFPGGGAPAKDPSRGLVIVVPGGGYAVRAEHERSAFADFFNAEGFASAILDYRTTGECEKPLRQGPLADARRAVRIVRAHAKAWGVRPDRIAMLGFSAGGHLTASAGIHFEDGRADGFDAAEKTSSRPDAMLLAYAVVNGHREHGHSGSALSLMGEKASPEELRFFDNDRFVTERTPPTFFFHTADDAVVPVTGAFAFATELRRARVPFEMHVYPSGPHGVGLALDRPELAGWTRLAVAWLKSMGY